MILDTFLKYIDGEKLRIYLKKEENGWQFDYNNPDWEGIDSRVPDKYRACIINLITVDDEEYPGSILIYLYERL